MEFKLPKIMKYDCNNLWIKHKDLCIPITFNNPLKEIYYYNPNTPDTNSKSIFLIEKQGFSGFLKIIGVQI